MRGGATPPHENAKDAPINFYERATHRKKPSEKHIAERAKSLVEAASAGEKGDDVGSDENL